MHIRMKQPTYWSSKGCRVDQKHAIFTARC